MSATNQAKPQAIYKYTLEHPNEPWTLIATEQGLCQVIYPGDDGSMAAKWRDRHAPGLDWLEGREPFDRLGIVSLLERYFAGETVSFGQVPLDLRGTPFQRKIWMELSQIVSGGTCTYGQLAASVGQPSAARAVGTAVGQNPLPIVLPCHRVVGSNGTMTGFRGGLRMKQRLLALEGVTTLEATGHERFRF